MNTRKTYQQGESKPAMTLLKELPQETQLKIIEILETHTYKDAQPLVAQLTGVECSINVLCRFRQWCQTEQELEHNTDLLEQVENYLQEREGDWSAERIQKSALSVLMMRSLSKNDVSAFSSVARLWMRREQLELREKTHMLDELKFKEHRCRTLDGALDALKKAFEQHPEAARLYTQARKLMQPENTTE